MKLQDRLPDALDRLAHAEPIAAPPPFDPTAMPLVDGLDDTGRPGRRPLAAAAAVAVVGLGGLIVVANRPTDGGAATQPTATPPPTPAHPSTSNTVEYGTVPWDGTVPIGALALPADSEFIAQGASDSIGPGDTVVRWYSAGRDTPELGPYLRVLSIPQTAPTTGDIGCVLAIDQTRDVTLADGTTACVADRGPDQTGRLALARESSAIVIEGNVTDDELIRAADHLESSTTHPGYEVTADGLPPDVRLTGEGWTLSDFAAMSFGAGDDSRPSANWIADDGRRSVFYVATSDDETWMQNLRLGVATITPMENPQTGWFGYQYKLADEPSFNGLFWHTNGVTYQLGSQGLAEAELAALADSLRPATAAEWQAMKDSVPQVTAPVETAATNEP